MRLAFSLVQQLSAQYSCNRSCGTGPGVVARVLTRSHQRVGAGRPSPLVSGSASSHRRVCAGPGSCALRSSSRWSMQLASRLEFVLVQAAVIQLGGVVAYNSGASVRRES